MKIQFQWDLFNWIWIISKMRRIHSVVWHLRRWKIKKPYNRNHFIVFCCCTPMAYIPYAVYTICCILWSMEHVLCMTTGLVILHGSCLSVDFYPTLFLTYCFTWLLPNRGISDDILVCQTHSCSILSSVYIALLILVQFWHGVVYWVGLVSEKHCQHYLSFCVLTIVRSSSYGTTYLRTWLCTSSLVT